uniref:B30.2/SPRY domain-containing protein n=1 Tax=Monopterus albus TaxID=43700 RepID=A0A3Q3K751_MONAL|nr:tripartite motif-containing protein 16-like [Monopterus albus]
MSLTEETAEKNGQTEPEAHHNEDILPNKSDREDKDVKVKDLLKAQQKEKHMISPLALLKEDLLKVFKDKEVKKEDGPSSQMENKPSTLSLLKEDLCQFKEDISSVFSSSQDEDEKAADPKLDQTAEKPLNLLSFLREDLSNILRIGPSKEKDKCITAKEDSSKIKVLQAEKTDKLFKNLFSTDRKLLKKVEDRQEAGEKEEQLDSGSRGNHSEQKEKLNDSTKDEATQPDDGERDICVSEETCEVTASVSEAQSEDMGQRLTTVRLSTAEQSCDSEEWSNGGSHVVSAEEEEERGDEPSEAPPSGISLAGLTDAETDEQRHQPGEDLWSPKNFATYLTLDPNTANSELHLTNNNRKAIRVWSDDRASEHPDRFLHCPQVLCREGLLDSAYWEVEWSGGADIGITYNSISRDGAMAACLLGYYRHSWSLECSEGRYTPCHNYRRFSSSYPQPFTHRVGVYLDWNEGSLSFYCVSQDALVHLHTFTCAFTEAVYPGFWVWAYDGSVSLCQVVLDWERLLQ